MLTAASIYIPQNPPVRVFSVMLERGKDETPQTLFITPDETAAQTYVNYQNYLHDSMRSKCAQAYKESKKWELQHPRPCYSAPILIPVSTSDIMNFYWHTEEHKARITAAQSENERRISIADMPGQEWDENMHSILNDRREFLLTAEEKLAYEHDRDNWYSVEELQWMQPLNVLLPDPYLAHLALQALGETELGTPST